MNTFTRPRYSLIVREATELLAKLEITEPPIAVDRVAIFIGAKIVFNDFQQEISGLLFREGDQLIIGVASEQSQVRQRFTIAHEVGHALLHNLQNVHVDKAFNVMFRSTASSDGQDILEIEANAFAAELLMPEDMLSADLTNVPLDMENGEQLSHLANRYEVSVQALTYRLLNLISRNRLHL